MKRFLTLFTALLIMGSMSFVLADTWTVAGSNATLLGTSWDVGNTANDMVYVKGNEWYLLKANKTLEAGTLEYKVCKDHGWGEAYPGNNAQFSLNAGTYDVLFKFVNDYNHSVSAAEVTSWTVAGTADVFGNGWSAEDTNNDMARSGNNWTLTKNHVLLAVGTTYLCKVAANHDWTYSFPGDNQAFSVVKDGYYDVTIDFNTSTLAVTVTTNFLESAVPPTPTISLHSNISGSWATSDAFAIATGDETASLTINNVAVGSYEFCVKINDNWTYNGAAFTRAYKSHAVTAGSGNCTFVADIVGNYTFTWMYESNTLQITYPDMTTKKVKFFAPRTENNPWAQVYAYAWNGDVTYSAWPGVEITATKDAGWYSYDVPVGASVLFHDNNGMQTNDITDITEDVCYVPTAIDYDATPKKVSVAVDADCKMEYYIAGSKSLIGGELDFDTNLPLDGNNQIVFHDVEPGTYAFKINNNTWAWSIGGIEHMEEGDCASIAQEVGTGDLGFKIDTKQDVTVTYYPETQKICLGAVTVPVDFGSYQRNVTAGNYGTICLPNNGTMSNNAKLYDLEYFNSENSTLYLLEVNGNAMVAGRPYIFLPSETSIEVTYIDNTNATAGSYNGLVGSYTQETITANAENYILWQNAYYLVNSTAYVGANRAYIHMGSVPTAPQQTNAPRRRVAMNVYSEQTTTDMENVQGDNVQCTKVLIDGHLYILRGEKMYNVNGQVVK